MLLCVPCRGRGWLHSVSSNAACTPLGPTLRKAVTGLWSFSSTWLHAALALPQVANASSHNLCLPDCREESLWGNVAALVAVKTLSWPLFSANDARLVFCLSWTTIMHRNALSPLFSFGFLLCFSSFHLLRPVPSTPSCFLLPLRLTFYRLCSTGLLLFWRSRSSWLDWMDPPYPISSPKSKAFAVKHRGLNHNVIKWNLSPFAGTPWELVPPDKVHSSAQACCLLLSHW